MAGYVDWTAPRFSATSIPTLRNLTLSEDEQRLIGYLQTNCMGDRKNMELTNAYYMGAQIIDNLKIAIPDALAQRLRTLVGWARVAVDPMVERLAVEGFRLPGETDVNETLAEIAAANGFDAEFTMAATDALAIRRAWWLVGSRPDSDLPRITVESPLSVAALYAADGRTLRALMQTYKEDDRERAAVMLPDRTIHLGQNEARQWELVDLDVHRFGYVSAVRMANNPRTDNRQGFSEITPELMSVIDSACRRLMGLEAASELYSVPRMLILGASAEDFQDANGEVRKAWDAYINKINFLEADDEGNMPTVTQLTAYDPSVFTKVIEMYASQAAGILAAVPQDLGLYTEGNPVSAEAWNATETRRNRRAISKQKTFGVPLVEVMQMAVRFQNNGDLPREFERVEVDWMRPEMVTFAQNADAIAKLANPKVNAIPAQSDVTLKRLGFSPVERAQLEKDRGEQVPNDIVAALQDAATANRAKPVTSGDPTNG